MITDEERKIRIIRGIANTRFPLIDQQNWPANYITITSDKGKIMAVNGPDEKMFPSIVFVNSKGDVKEIGQVETLTHII